MTTLNLYPTHSCFDDAAEFFKIVVNENLYTKEWICKNLLIVHGICTLPTGELYAHAWVEIVEEKSAIFKMLKDNKEPVFVESEKKSFYKQFGVVEHTAYTLADIREQIKIHGDHTGPYKAEYKALCGTGDKRKWDSNGNLIV